jgi:hypothetical protein
MEPRVRASARAGRDGPGILATASRAGGGWTGSTPAHCGTPKAGPTATMDWMEGLLNRSRGSERVVERSPDVGTATSSHTREIAWGAAKIHY